MPPAADDTVGIYDRHYDAVFQKARSEDDAHEVACFAVWLAGCGIGEAEATRKRAPAIEVLQARIAELEGLLNTPEIDEFDKAVPLEAGHQVLRWGAPHDIGKGPEDWFWLVGYLAGKALAAFKAGDLTKAKHHCISTAAALRNWHAHLRTGSSVMRPGIEPPKETAMVGGVAP